MTPRPCLDCGRPARHPRCPTCDITRRRRLYDNPAWKAYRKSRIEGSPWCAACGATDDLTLDHSTDTVMCRPCNSSRRWNHLGTR